MQTDPSPTLIRKIWMNVNHSVKIFHDHSRSSEYRQIHIEAPLLEIVAIKDVIVEHYESFGYKTKDTTFFHNDSIVFSFIFQKKDSKIVVMCQKLPQKREFLIQIMVE